MDTTALETIAAISTAPGEGGIAVVRLSGTEALGIADRIIRCCGHSPSHRPGGTFLHGWLVEPGAPADGAALDEVVVLIFRAPHSYTREDVVEIQVHGGRKPAQRALRVALEAGARPAEPGEFTRRAFLNGRIDLVQAEAVADLIRARSDRAASAAVEQISGSLSFSLSSIYDILIEVLADIEATLDFEEDELPEGTLDGMTARIQSVSAHVDQLLDTWEEGHLLREGAMVVISGQPNVGKSTLMNAVLGRDRVIVTETPGTTRDLIEEEVVIDGIPVRLIDTAGLRDTDCDIEQAGIDRARESAARADLNLHVIDGSKPLDRDERERLESLVPEKSVIVLNKSDLGCRVEREDLARRGCLVLHCCAVDSRGVQAVVDALRQKLGGVSSAPHAVISERHRRLLRELNRALGEAAELLANEQGDRVVLAAELLHEGLESLGRATGRIYSHDLLDSIFSRFCVGK